MAENGSNHGATILIAEDEPAVRNLLQKILNSAGYQVLVASDGKKALEIADQHKRNIDLLLSDIVMPEMSGVELAKTLKSKRPEMRIILTSAYPQGMHADALSRFSNSSRRPSIWKCLCARPHDQRVRCQRHIQQLP